MSTTRRLRIILRFGMVSLASAAVDNVLFYFFFHALANIAAAQIAARAISVVFNYALVRRRVFASSERHGVLLPRYLTLVALNTLASYAGIRILSSLTPLGVVPSKIVAETILFLLNFAVQRRYVFPHRRPEPSR